MANISGERLKEMEAEMNRFEEEILSRNQVEENDALRDIDERGYQSGPIVTPGPAMLPPGIRLGPRPETSGPRMIIHTNALNQPQHQITGPQIRERLAFNNFEMRPPPPPPIALTNPETRFPVPHQPSMETNIRPSFIPPQLRYRANYPGPTAQRPFYPMMGPPRPYMMGSGSMISPSGSTQNGPGFIGVGQNGSIQNGVRPTIGVNYCDKPNFNEKVQDNSPSEASKVSKSSSTISGPKIVYSAPPVKRKIEPETTTSKEPSKKSKLDKDGKKKTKKTKTKNVNSEQSTDPKKEETPTEAIPLPPIELKPPASKQLFKLAPSAVSKPEGNKDTAPIVLPPQPPKLTLTGSKKEKKEKKNKFVRMAASAVWEDPSLGDWDQDDFRMFCGDLGNEVGDDTLARAFNKYASFQKARVIRDKRTNKTKGFGFVSFKDPNDFVRAMREMNGRYVGNRPIKLRKSVWQERQIDNVKKKEREKKKLGFK